MQRAARVMPAYWCAFLVVVPLGAALDVAGGSGWIRNLLLIHTFSPATVLTGIGAAWTLSIEMCFYLSLPLLFVLLRFVSRRQAVATRGLILFVTLVILIVVAYATQIVWWNNRHGLLATAHLWLPSHGDALASGMLLALLVEQRGNTPLASRISGRLERLTGPLLAASTVTWLLSSRVGSPTSLTDTLTFRAQLLGHLLFTVSATLFLIPFCVSSSQSRIMRWSSVRPIAWLASISYGVYLWHMAFLSGGPAKDILPYSPGDGRLFTRLAVVIPASIVVAAISYRFIERPLINLAKRRRPDGRDTAPDQPADHATPSPASF